MLEEFTKLPLWAKVVFSIIVVIGVVFSSEFVQDYIDNTGEISQGSSEVQYQKVGITVRNRDNSQPIEKIVVQIVIDGPPVSKMTGRNGYIEIRMPVRQTAQVTLTKQGFKTATETINLEIDPDNTRILYLDPENE